MIPRSPTTQEKLNSATWSYKWSYHKKGRWNLIIKKIVPLKHTLIFQFTMHSLEFGVSSTNPKPLSGSPPSASEITASQPRSRDAVCLVIWWLIPCLFPTNLLPDKGVASTLVNMGDLAALADSQTRVLVEEKGSRGITSSPFTVHRKAPFTSYAVNSTSAKMNI